jgi:hypothetical protein
MKKFNNSEQQTGIGYWRLTTCQCALQKKQFDYWKKYNFEIKKHD